MAALKPGDRVNCRIKDGTIVSAYREYDEIRTFEVLAHGDYGYHLYVPQYLCIRNSVTIDVGHCKRLGVDPRFLGEQMAHVSESMICDVIQRLDGMSCGNCKDFVPMATANQEDKTSFVCWACRANPYR
jgi:hypothetical protein